LGAVKEKTLFNLLSKLPSSVVQFLHIDHQHARTLIRAALISSPILGLYSTIPGLLFIANLDLSEAAVMNFQWPRNAIRLLAISAVNLLLFLSSIYVVHGKHVLENSRWKFPLCLAIGLGLVFAVIRLMPPERVQITGWFRLYPLVGITTNMFVILGIIQIVGSSIENERLRNEKLTLDIANLQARLGQLRLQIQPHFLFNALANLQSWVRQEPEQAAVYLGTLSSFLRTSTQSQLKDMHPVGDEMKLVKNYLEIQKMRFGSALDFTIDVDAELLDLNIPTFAIQVLVENAIKHNRFSPSDPLKLAISGKGNQIAIANELRPLPDSARAEPSGIGLTNLSDRFHLIGLRPPKVQASNDRFEVIIFLEPCT
jgi:hypothetical protein